MIRKKHVMIFSRKSLKIGSSIIFILSGVLGAKAQGLQIDRFSIQILFEKMYETDFNGKLIRELLYKCSGDLLDFAMITNFPEIGYFSRKHLLGRGAGNNIINIVTFGKIGNDAVWGRNAKISKIYV